MPQPPRHFYHLTDEELGPLLVQAASGGIHAGNDFFGRFNYVDDLFEGRHSAALDNGISLLLRCQAIDAQAYGEIHKGTPFYWIGTAAFLVHDYQTAVFFFDAAVSEDLRAGFDPAKSPPMKFILLEGDDPRQAAQELVKATQSRMEDLLDQYNSIPGRPAGSSNIDMPAVRDRFLRPAVSPQRKEWRSLATTLISFIIEWDYRARVLGLRVAEGTAEPFYIHLFKGCLLLESLLKANPANPIPPDGKTLGVVLQHLYRNLGIRRNLKIGQTDFPTVLADLNGAHDSIETAIQFTGRIRNTLGHDLGWRVPLTKSQYERLLRMIGVSCLHAISTLYPDGSAGYSL